MGSCEMSMSPCSDRSVIIYLHVGTKYKQIVSYSFYQIRKVMAQGWGSNPLCCLHDRHLSLNKLLNVSSPTTDLTLTILLQKLKVFYILCNKAWDENARKRFILSANMIVQIFIVIIKLCFIYCTIN